MCCKVIEMSLSAWLLALLVMFLVPNPANWNLRTKPGLVSAMNVWREDPIGKKKKKQVCTTRGGVCKQINAHSATVTKVQNIWEYIHTKKNKTKKRQYSSPKQECSCVRTG